MFDLTDNTLDEFKPGEVFTTYEVAELSKAPWGLRTVCAKTLLHKLLKDSKIIRYRHGAYYKRIHTAFGEMHPDTYMYAIKYLIKDKKRIIGYECGASLANRIGLSTQMPRDLHIASNRYGKCKIPIQNITIHKPTIRVTNRNHSYIQILDLLGDWDSLFIDAPDPYAVLLRVLNRCSLDKKRLMAYAARHYPADVTQRLNTLQAGVNII